MSQLFSGANAVSMDDDYRRDHQAVKRYRRAAQALAEVLAENRVLSHESRRVFIEAKERCEARAAHIEAVWD